MTKQEQIEEVLKYCPAHNFNRYCGKCALGGIMGCRNELMKKSLSYIERLKEEKEKARKETAKEIAIHIKRLLDDCKDVNIKIQYAGLLVWLQSAFGLEGEE